MAESWYASTTCVDIHQLKPWSLTIIGFIIQSLISLIIASTDKPSSPDSVPIMLNQSVDKSERCDKCCDKIKQIPNKRWFKILKIMLILWQSSSIIIILILDIKNIVDKSHLFDKSWDVYKCYASVLTTSSNSKTLFSYCMWIYFYNQEHKFMDGPEAVNTNTFKFVFILLAGGLGYAQLLSLVALIIPSLFSYIWVYGIVLLAIFVIASIISFIGKCIKISDSNFELILCNVFAFAFYVSFVLLALSVINLFSGITYWHSFKYVLTEPNWHEYIQHVMSNAEAKFQFVTMLL